MSRKPIFLEDLTSFCVNNNIFSFQARGEDDCILVTVPATYATQSISDDQALFLDIKACHTEKNLNTSFISKESMQTALPSFGLKPILASIIEIVDEDGNPSLDFNGHDMDIGEDKMNPGEQRVHYIETMVGVVSPENIRMEKEPDSDKHFVYATGIVYKDYTYAADILEKRKDVDVSVELSVSKFSYDAKNKMLVIEEFKFSGITLLGKSVKPGMVGSHATTMEFSLDNLSTSIDDKEQFAKELNKAIAKFHDLYGNNDSTVKGGEQVNKLEELLAKYNVAVEDLTFKYENLADDALEEAFKAAYEDSGDEGAGSTGEGGGAADDTAVDGSDGEDGQDDGHEENSDEQFTLRRSLTELESGIYELTYQLSHSDIRNALYNLIVSYEELDNTYHFITDVYDDHFIFEDLCNGDIWGQAYKVDGDNVSFSGERYKLYRELLTESEKIELDSMRSNYAELEAKLKSFESAADRAEKKAVVDNPKYSVLKETDSYKDLMDNIDNYSLEEFTKEVKALHSDYVSEHPEALQFSANAPRSTKKVAYGFNFDSEKKPYGSLFD